MSNAVLPASRRRLEVREVRHNPRVDLLNRKRLLLTVFNRHEDQGAARIVTF